MGPRGTATRAAAHLHPNVHEHLGIPGEVSQSSALPCLHLTFRTGFRQDLWSNKWKRRRLGGGQSRRCQHSKKVYPNEVLEGVPTRFPACCRRSVLHVLFPFPESLVFHLNAKAGAPASVCSVCRGTRLQPPNHPIILMCLFIEAAQGYHNSSLSRSPHPPTGAVRRGSFHAFIRF